MGEKKRRERAESVTPRDLQEAYEQVLNMVPGGNGLEGPNAKSTPCLGCGAMLDSGTMIGGTGAPHPGALSICWKCGHLQMYAEDMSFRPLTDAELLEVAGDPRIVLANTIREPVIKLYHDDKARFLTKLERKEQLARVLEAVLVTARQNASKRSK
jgi:hypothetical protein